MEAKTKEKTLIIGEDQNPKAYKFREEIEVEP